MVPRCESIGGLPAALARAWRPLAGAYSGFQELRAQWRLRAWCCACRNGPQALRCCRLMFVPGAHLRPAPPSIAAGASASAMQDAAHVCSVCLRLAPLCLGASTRALRMWLLASRYAWATTLCRLAAAEEAGVGRDELDAALALIVARVRPFAAPPRWFTRRAQRTRRS